MTETARTRPSTPTPRSTLSLAQEFDWTSIHEQLEAHGIRPWRSRISVDVVDADDELADQLGVDPGRGLLRVSGVTYDRTDAPIFADSVCYHPERYRFSAVLERR